MKLLRTLAAFAAVCLASVAFAADPSGTWTFAGGFGRGGPGGGGGGGAGKAGGAESTLVLAVKDGKLTGKLTPPAFGDQAPQAIEIKDATVTGDTVAFSVERAGRNGGPARVTKYSGKLEGDTITGTSEAPGRDGATMKNEWVAKRSK